MSKTSKPKFQVGESVDESQAGDAEENTQQPTRGQRIKTLTEKGKEMQQGKVKALQERFNYIYDKWKIKAKYAKKSYQQNL